MILSHSLRPRAAARRPIGWAQWSSGAHARGADAKAMPKLQEPELHIEMPTASSCTNPLKKRGRVVGRVPSPDGTESGLRRSLQAAAAYEVLWSIHRVWIRPDTMGVRGITTFNHTQPQCNWSSIGVDYVIIRSGSAWRVASATTTVLSDGPCE